MILSRKLLLRKYAIHKYIFLIALTCKIFFFFFFREDRLVTKLEKINGATKKRSNVMTALCKGSLDDVIKTQFKIVESVKLHLRKATMVYNVKEGYFRHTRCWRVSRYHSEMEWRAIPLVVPLPGPYAWITLVASPLCIFQTFHCLRVTLPFVNYWITSSSTCNYITSFYAMLLLLLDIFLFRN